jgi:hypothetical protein
MGQAVVMLDPAGAGVYELPPSIPVSTEDPLDLLEELVSPVRERGKLKLNGKFHMVSVYVETVSGIRFPHILVSDLEALL